MRGMEHIGFTVPDINVACDFFERVLGAKTLFTAATNFRADGDWMRMHLNVDPSCVITEFRYMRCGNGANLEVFEYQAPIRRNRRRKTATPAGIIWHFTSMT